MSQGNVETDLARVMKGDGVAKADTHSSINQTLTRLGSVKERMGEASWSARVIYTDSMSAVLIHQNPGEGNRKHYHENDDEWWVVMQGEIEWELEGKGVVRAKKDDIVFVPRGVIHTIRAVGDIPSIRLAIGRPDVPHTYV